MRSKRSETGTDFFPRLLKCDNEPQQGFKTGGAGGGGWASASKCNVRPWKWVSLDLDTHPFLADRRGGWRGGQAETKDQNCQEGNLWECKSCSVLHGAARPEELLSLWLPSCCGPPLFSKRRDFYSSDFVSLAFCHHRMLTTASLCTLPRSKSSWTALAGRCGNILCARLVWTGNGLFLDVEIKIIDSKGEGFVGVVVGGGKCDAL